MVKPMSGSPRPHNAGGHRTRTTSRPGSTAPTSTTRRSTGRMRSWPRTTAPRRPGPRAQAQGQGAGRTADALRPGLVLAGPGVRLARARCAPTRWPGAARSPGRRACRPLDGAAPAAVFAAVEAAALAAVAGGAVRAGHLVEREGRPGHPRQGRRARSTRCRGATSANASTPAPRPSMVQFFHHGQLIKTHPRKDRGKQTDLRRLPAGEDRLPHAHPDLVPAPGRRGRPGRGGGDRRAARRERAVPAARRPRRARAGRQATTPARLEAACAKATAAGDPSYRTIKGILAAGTETAPRPRARPVTPGRPRTCTAPTQLFADPRHRIGPHPAACRFSPTSSPCPPRAAPTPRTRPPRPRHRHCHRAEQQRGPLVSTQPTGPIAADRSAGDAAALPPPPPAPPDPPVPTADPVTAGEIAEFLRHLTRSPLTGRGRRPADHAALLARKAELFTRIADQHARRQPDPPSTAAPTTPTTPEGRTP